MRGQGIPDDRLDEVISGSRRRRANVIAQLVADFSLQGRNVAEEDWRSGQLVRMPVCWARTAAAAADGARPSTWPPSWVQARARARMAVVFPAPAGRELQTYAGGAHLPDQRSGMLSGQVDGADLSLRFGLDMPHLPGRPARLQDAQNVISCLGDPAGLGRRCQHHRRDSATSAQHRRGLAKPPHPLLSYGSGFVFGVAGLQRRLLSQMQRFDRGRWPAMIILETEGELAAARFVVDTPGSRVADLYEVCGQAQKSIMWRRSDLKPFFRTLDDRARKKQRRDGVSPFEVGDIRKLYEIQDGPLSCDDE
jgi:hypothetical protein